MGTASLSVLVTLVMAVLAAQAMSAAADGYSYTLKTPQYDMEAIVKQEVQKAIKCNPGVGAALIRLVFHDCWVHGCDASVLLDKAPYGSIVEKNASNNIGLDGFDVIDSIKVRLPDVSCADIVVFAGRESARILSNGNIDYALVPGRLMDGVVSSAADANATLPQSTFSFQQLKDNFNKTAGFDVEDLVILSGAHSIGVAHRTSFQDRLIDSATQTPINKNYQTALSMRVKFDESQTPNPTEKNNIRDMDLLFRGFSGYNATGVNTCPPAAGDLDNSYYTANLQNMVLFKSDWELNTDTFAKGKLSEYKNNATDWNLDFGDAMERLSKLTAPGPHFEIRQDCRRTNLISY